MRPVPNQVEGAGVVHATLRIVGGGELDDVRAIGGCWASHDPVVDLHIIIGVFWRDPKQALRSFSSSGVNPNVESAVFDAPSVRLTMDRRLPHVDLDAMTNTREVVHKFSRDALPVREDVNINIKFLICLLPSDKYTVGLSPSR